MAETNETIADIIAEMRIGVNALQKYGAKPRNRDEWMVFLAMFADRIESAYKREVGNAAKLGEAVGKILWCLEWMFNNTDDKSVQSHLGEPIALARAALSAPPRNCDIGTVDEQIARHYRYCSCRLGDGDDPHGCERMSCSECVLRWAQMEYKEEAK